MEDLYCDGCERLNVSEEEQTKLKHRDFGNKSMNRKNPPMYFEHHCLKYSKEVKHSGQHPHICRLQECLNDDGKEQKEKLKPTAPSDLCPLHVYRDERVFCALLSSPRRLTFVECTCTNHSECSHYAKAVEATQNYKQKETFFAFSIQPVPDTVKGVMELIDEISKPKQGGRGFRIK